MKHLRAGQIMTYKKKLYRATKATAGCVGCDLVNVNLCPQITCVNVKRAIQVHCNEDNIQVKQFVDIPVLLKTHQL